MVTYGVIPAHDDPSKEADAQFTYTFAGWTPEVVSVTGEATYTATYDGTLRSYTVTWLQDDGTLIGTDTLEYGQTPAHADPSKTADAENTYTFAGWSPEVVSVTGDAAYTATYTGTKNKYTVTWLNEDGSVLGRTKVEYGQTPAHDGPDKKADAKYTYTFADWDPAPVPVTGNATYTATYMQTLRIYVIIWQQDDGTEIDRTKVEYGQMPVHADPAKESDADITYTFAGWSPEIKSVTGEAIYRAAYTATGNVCTVTWLQDDGTEIDRTTVGYGQIPAHADPEKAADAKYTYTFTGWDPGITAATGDVTYRATYSAKVNEYTVTFRNEDGTVLQTVTVAYGETPEYTGETPVKAADADRTYTFAGWDKKISAVTGETEYTAMFRASEQTNPAPVTGDRVDLVLPVAVMIVSGAAAAFVLGKRRAGAR